jgi:DNA mismatch repair protein MutL
VADNTTESDGIIHVMPEPLANKIAAGEVVQRPASVAKELIENALDAGAQQIDLIVKDAGSTLVQVVDDGCGMSPNDAVRCFKRHATSKINDVEDLERIQTLGFRGEALASIAAVSQVELKTKRVEDDAGVRVRVEGGEMTTNEPCAAPHGTSIAVRNLFYNVPARRNFLKTAATEFRHLTDTFQEQALPNPAVGFQLVHNGNSIYDLAAAEGETFLERVRTRIIDVLGTDREGKLIPVEDESSYLAARGYISQPEYHRKTRGEQFLFVNGRAVQSRYLSHAVRTAYDDLLPDGAFPFFALFLQVDPRRVDVNVHPTKAEVKFDDKSGVYAFVRNAARQALASADLTPQLANARSVTLSEGDRTSRPDASSPPSRRARKGPSGFPGSDEASSRPSARSNASSRRRPSSSQGDWAEALYGGPEASQEDTASSTDTTSETSSAADESSTDQTPQTIWSLHDTYLLMPSDEGMRMVDQRAAHVRVLYERALENLDAGRAESQQLLFPETFDLPRSDVDLFDELLPDLQALGFDVARLSGRTVAIRAVPAGLKQGEQNALEAVLEQYKASGEVVDEQQKRLALALARRHAVHRGEALSPDEQRALIGDLFDCEMPYADPSGNPTMVTLSMDELAKTFRS